MANPKYVVFPGECKHPQFNIIPAKAERKTVTLEGSVIPGCIFTTMGWYMEDLEIPGLHKHESSEVYMFLGGNERDHENLYAQVEIQIENDILRFEKTCCVFIPAGVAHGNVKVRNVTRPVAYCMSHPLTDTYEESPAEATAEKGKYAYNYVDEYDTTGVDLPNAAPEVMTRLFYMDNSRIIDAPYFESVWFNIPTPAFLEPHFHELDEIICFAGPDPEHPEELGGKVNFYVEGEPIPLERSCLLYIPRGVYHVPFDIERMDQPCLHFSGGNNSNYYKG